MPENIDAERQSLLQEIEKLHSPEAPQEAAQPIVKDEVINGTTFHVQEAAPAVSPPNYNPDIFSAISLNIAEGLTGGFSGEIAGGVVGGGEWLMSEDHSFADLSAMYRKNRDTVDQVRIAHNEKFPLTGFVSELAGGITGYSALAKAGLVSNTVKSGAQFGAVSAFGKSEGVDPGEIAKGAVIGGATQGLFNMIPGVKKPMVDTADDVVKKETDAILNGFNITPKGEYTVTEQAITAKDVLGLRGIKPSEWAQEIKVTPDGKPLFEVTDNFKTVHSKASAAIAQEASGINAVTGQADSFFLQDPGAGVNAGKIINTLTNDVLPALGDGSPSAVKKIVGILNGVAGRPYISFSEAQVLRSQISEAIDFTKGSLNNSENIKWVSNGVFREEMLQSMRALPDKELAPAFEKLSRSYGNWMLAKDLLEIPALSSELTHLGAVQGKMLNRFRKGMTSATLNSKSGMVNVAVEGLQAALGDPMAKLTGKRMASLAKISGALSAAPGKYQDLANRLVMSATRPHMYFQNELGYAESVIDLNANPVQRTTDDLVLKLPQILNIINDKSPATGSQLLKAVQSGNEAQIGAIMSDLGRIADSQGLIAKGVGWNGKAATAQDLADWESQIKQSPQNHTTKMRQLEALRIFGVGPVFEEKRDYIRQTMVSKRNKSGKKLNKL